VTVTMFDSTDISQLPSGSPAYAGYVDGAYANAAEIRAKFPQARVLGIAVFPWDDGDCLDVEATDATVGQAPAWVKRQHARGLARPAVYASASVMPSLWLALSGAGIARAAVRLWSAHYTGSHICGPATCAFRDAQGRVVPACDGTQFTDTALGRNLDQSVLADDFFGGAMSVTGPESYDTADKTVFKDLVHTAVLEMGYNSSGWTLGKTAQDVQAKVVPGVATLQTSVSALRDALAVLQTGESALQAGVTALQATVAAMPGGDPAAIAAAIESDLGAELATAVADELVKRLAQ
jgi:hypothetical protein